MYIFTLVKKIDVTLYGEMCVSDGKASMPITCRTSSNCPPSAWLKCFLACLTYTETDNHKISVLYATIWKLI